MKILHRLGLGVKSTKPEPQPSLVPTAAKLPFFWLDEPRPRPNPPDLPEPVLVEGWQWFPVPWLYYWMILMNPTNPINNRCRIKSYGVNPDTTWPLILDVCRAHCTLAHTDSGKTFLERAILSFRKALEKPEAQQRIRHIRGKLREIDLDTGFDRLLKEDPYRSEEEADTTLFAWLEDEVPFPSLLPSGEALSLFLEGDRIMVFAVKGEPPKVSGRHRICVAYKFNIPALPVYVEAD